LKTTSVLLFVTCGTSALKNLQRERSSREAIALADSISKYLSPTCRDKESYATRHALLECVVAAHTATLRCPHWATEPLLYQSTPAELISTFSLASELKSKNKTIAEAWLLASGTPEGRLAAEVNRQLFLKEPLVGLVKMSSSDVIRGWDERFIDITPPLYDLVARKKSALQQQLPRSAQVYFNITGGFKGAIPSITALAVRNSWRIYYQHETLKASTYFVFDETQLVHMESQDDGTFAL
jgi:putative CRISPR-associated protein (TIGR02619 family)